MLLIRRIIKIESLNTASQIRMVLQTSARGLISSITGDLGNFDIPLSGGRSSGKGETDCGGIGRIVSHIHVDMLSTIHSADGRTTQSGSSGHGKTVLAVMPIGYFIGCRWSSNGEGIEIQAYHTNLIAAFFDSVGQRGGVGIG